MIRAYAWPAFRLTNRLHRWGRLGRAINRVAVPFLNYRHKVKFREKSDAFLVQFGIHDTFDALSPRYDRPIRAAALRAIAAAALERPFEVVESPSITLLRSVLSDGAGATTTS